ncbi:MULTISPECIES: diacylglycerol kinase family protein [Gordonibacter]|uniref:Diacylglycerol kinase family protein n=1 Tax=Gordonibacter faecis TaxID=3047475 RepID=A0ABT7DIE5_9ACTN|nr:MULTISPECIES: diacylglycerol kinase family protein [unclassified Gordonibacter]MDJ1649296.1 diacylglycerol kinase family protein [Gordonibacter sp. KGMB12511]HIW75237.1 diacylglycerol kinase family protein [Candidatus Gordonibacter avicola]
MDASNAMDDEERSAAGGGSDTQPEAPAGFVRNEQAKEARARFSLIRAFKCAFDGIAYVVRTQRNMKIHLVIAVVAVALGLALGIDGASWAAVILCIAAVFAAECVNTAIESVVDLVSPDYHELARRAKDCAAGAVLIFALVSVVVAVVVYGPRAWLLLFG